MIYMLVKKLLTDFVQFIALIPFLMVAFMSVCPAFVAGLTGAFLSILSNLSPLEKVPHIISSRDHRFVNLFVAMSTVFNASIWTVYALFTGDMFVFVPQFMGLLSGLVQVILYLWATRSLDEKAIPVKFIFAIFYKL